MCHLLVPRWRRHWMPNPRKLNPSLMCTTRGLGPGEPEPEPGEHGCDLIAQRLGVLPGAFDQHGEVVGLCRFRDYADCDVNVLVRVVVLAADAALSGAGWRVTRCRGTQGGCRVRGSGRAGCRGGWTRARAFSLIVMSACR